MAGFILKNTLSENGAVTRGICETNENGYLTAVHETSGIVKTAEGAAVEADGVLICLANASCHSPIPVSYTHLDVYKRQDRRKLVLF